MMKYVINPNLPSSDVTMVAVSSAAGEATAALNAMGVKTLIVTPHPALPAGIASHADLQLFHLGGKSILTCSEHLFVGESGKNFSPVLAGDTLEGKYPKDVPLNAAVVGKHIILNEHTVSKSILEYAYQNDLKIINVNQGYAKCSVCIVDENSIITDDCGIAASAGNFLNDVLFISKGAIRLKGYGYGFFGGCCGKIARDKLAVNGSIKSHPDYKRIIDFVHSHSVEIVELKSGELEDIGGILPLCEKNP